MASKPGFNEAPANEPGKSRVAGLIIAAVVLALQ
jgi:hypothetical protein